MKEKTKAIYMVMKTDIAVIGASPAGLMAARYAALGGAKVTLFEKKETIGKSLIRPILFSKE